MADRQLLTKVSAKACEAFNTTQTKNGLNPAECEFFDLLPNGETYANNTVALREDVYDNRLPAVRLANYYEFMTDDRNNQNALRTCEIVKNYRGLSGIKQMWRLGYRTSTNVRKLWMESKGDTNALLDKLQLL